MPKDFVQLGFPSSSSVFNRDRGAPAPKERENDGNLYGASSQFSRTRSATIRGAAPSYSRGRSGVASANAAVRPQEEEASNAAITGSILSALEELTHLLRLTPRPPAVEFRGYLRLLRDRTIEANQQHRFTGTNGTTRRITEHESGAILYLLLASTCFVQDAPPTYHQTALQKYLSEMLEHAEKGDRQQFHEAVEGVVQHILLFTPLQAPVPLTGEEEEEADDDDPSHPSEKVLFFSPHGSPIRRPVDKNHFPTRSPSQSGQSSSQGCSSGTAALPPRRCSSLGATADAAEGAEAGAGTALDHCADFLIMKDGHPAVDPDAWQLWVNTIEKCYMEWAEAHHGKGRRAAGPMNPSSETQRGNRSRAQPFAHPTGDDLGLDRTLPATRRSRAGGLGRGSGGASDLHRTVADKTEDVSFGGMSVPPRLMERAPRLLLRQYWQNPNNLYGQFCTFLLVLFFTKGVNSGNYDARLMKLVQYFHYHVDVHHRDVPIPLLHRPSTKMTHRSGSRSGHMDASAVPRPHRHSSERGVGGANSAGCGGEENDDESAEVSHPMYYSPVKAERRRDRLTSPQPQQPRRHALKPSVHHPPEGVLDGLRYGSVERKGMHHLADPCRRSSVYHFQHKDNELLDSRRPSQGYGRALRTGSKKIN